MLDHVLIISTVDLNRILFVAFGIWFTLVCFYKMIETAVRSNFPEAEDR
ncbi:MAG: hypothetical protein ACM3PY_15760 [Omnitrophica WOR_2 bacterium]